MLSNEQREYLKNYRKTLDQVEKTADIKKMNGALRQMNLRIRDKALEAIKDLTLIAQEMNERQKNMIFTKDIMRDLTKFALQHGDRKPFRLDITQEEMEEELPEPIYNKRIFDLGMLLGEFGVSSAYGEISWKLRIRDMNRQPSIGEMWELIDVLNDHGYKIKKKQKIKLS